MFQWRKNVNKMLCGSLKRKGGEEGERILVRFKIREVGRTGHEREIFRERREAGEESGSKIKSS